MVARMNAFRRPSKGILMMTFTTRMLTLLGFVAGIAVAAPPWTVTFADPVTAGGTQLKAGSYRVEMQDGKAVFKLGKIRVEIPATLQPAEEKYATTSAMISSGSTVKEIDLGGTKSRIVF